MKHVARMLALGLVLAAGQVFAEEDAKNLPTLLIKGKVVSLDTADPAANLMKVKDRYGFETPIFLTDQTKYLQGETEATKDGVAVEASVEVEYNFDINTAKRYAVMVKLPTAEPVAPAPAAQAPVTPEATPTETPVEPAAETPVPAPAAQPAPGAEQPAETPMEPQPAEGAPTQ